MTVQEAMTPDVRFDCALRAAEAWRLDAELYLGGRREVRIAHARRLEAVAERLLRDA